MIAGNEDLVGEAAHLYESCMEEVKFRFLQAGKVWAEYSEALDYSSTWLALERVAVHYRKLIELIALASIVANKDEYSRARESFAKGWNARLIFRDLARLNPDFFPTPIYDGQDYESNPDGPQIIDEYEDGFVDLEGAIRLYEKCSSLLHAENRLSRPLNVREIAADLRNYHPLFERLLDEFWVTLLPERYRYLVQLRLNEVADVKVYGMVLGEREGDD